MSPVQRLHHLFLFRKTQIMDFRKTTVLQPVLAWYLSVLKIKIVLCRCLFGFGGVKQVRLINTNPLTFTFCMTLKASAIASRFRDIKIIITISIKEVYGLICNISRLSGTESKELLDHSLQ